MAETTLPAMITRIELDAGAQVKEYLIEAKQGDKASRYVSILLKNDGKEYEPPEGADIVANFQKPSGKFCYNAAMVHEGNRLLVELTNQVLAEPGTVYCDVEIRSPDSTQVLTSCAFTIQVGKSYRNEAAILSSNEMTAFDQKWAALNADMEEWATAERLRQEAEAARIAAETARQNAEKARATAETSRQAAENARESAEAARQENTRQAVQNAQNATQAATSAAARAEAALQNQEQLAQTLAAAQAAQTAAETAQGKAETAQGKAETAQAAAQTAKTAAETAQGKAETAQSKAETAQTAAQTAKTAAETAQSKAETAQGKAESAAASAAEYAGLSKGAWYGVEFSGSTSAGTRTGAAKDFVFTPATDTSEGQNDFDAVYPWAGMRRCCCTLNGDGTVKVNAYKGQPGYIEDGTNGEVLVEVPLFYVKGMVDVDPQISMLPLPGFRAPRKFRNADGSLKQRCYLRAFPGYVGSDGKLHSIAGVVPSGNKTISAFLTAARQWGEKYCIETSADVEVMLYLMIVVYGSRNFQTKVNGCVSLYATNIAITAAAESANTVTTAAGALQVGDVISIGTGGENESVAYRRIVTAVDGAVATFDGDPVTTTTNHKVWRIMQATGTANGVLGTCGSRVSNSDGKHSFVFYGLENPLYGNQWRFECDWKLIDGVPYYCDDPTKYQWTSATDYTKLDTLTLPGEGWAVKLQADERAPWLQITAAVGGSSGTFLADYFWINKSGVRIVRRGAYSSGGGGAGPFCVYLSGDASLSWWDSGGDLSIPG